MYCKLVVDLLDFVIRTMAEIGSNIVRAKKLLVQSQLVSIPTETVYGLAANALDPDAVVKIFKVKDRPYFDPLIVHTHSLDQISKYTLDFPHKLYQLGKLLWPGPLTVILPKKKIIPDLVTAGKPDVAIRIPGHPLTLKLLQNLPFPLAAPSANPFGYISPTNPAHVLQNLGDKVPYILDGGPCELGIESTIVGFRDDCLLIYRLGAISVEKIATIAKTDNIKIITDVSRQIEFPGLSKTHYAPHKKMVLGDIEELLKSHDLNKVGILSFKHIHSQIDLEKQVILSRKGSLEEAAKHLFSALRKLDQLQIPTILAEYVPDEGLGRAINDRLTRAAAKTK